MTTAAGLFQQERDDFMAAVFDVDNEMGRGFLEEGYHESLEHELSDRRIPFITKPRLSLFHKRRSLKENYEADRIVIDEIIVGLKAGKSLLSEYEAQLINDLGATRKRVGYLINFGSFPKLD